MAFVTSLSKSDHLQDWIRYCARVERPDKDMNAALKRFFHENVQISRTDAENRREIAFPNVEKILAYVNEKDARFSKVPARVGSYWQGLKVEKADEFDYSVILDGLGSFSWVTLSHPRYYNFNKPVDPDHQTIPQDLDVVKTSVPLPSPPQGYVYMSHRQDMQVFVKGWTDISDLTREGEPGKVDIVPFLVRKRLKQLLTEAKRDLDLRGEIRQSRKVNGPALTMYFKVNNREIAIDFAPVIRAHLPFPSWIKWPRTGARWPSDEKIRQIKEFGINVVAKKDFWWMLSFAEVEKMLVAKLDADGGKRKQVHRIMKKLNGDFWCNTTKRVITSYILKNIWFWEMENFPYAADWDNDTLWTRLESMTKMLLQCIKDRQLKQYFYPDFNLLKSKDVGELDIAAVKIQEFLNDPLKFIDFQ